MFESILKPINTCNLTSLEKQAKCKFIDVTHFIDDQGRNRFVMYSSESLKTPLSALLVEKNPYGKGYTIKVAYTVKESRRMGYSKGLLAVARISLGSVVHSDYLTNDGQLFAKQG